MHGVHNQESSAMALEVVATRVSSGRLHGMPDSVCAQHKQTDGKAAFRMRLGAYVHRSSG